jgi:hypothetical protein
MFNQLSATPTGNVAGFIAYGFVCLGVMVALPAHAGQEKGQPYELPAGALACQNRAAVMAYRQAEAKAPAFAADLIDRATCYIVKEPTATLTAGKEQGISRYKLLSGHTIWSDSVRK